MEFVAVNVESASADALNYLVCVALGSEPVLFDDAFRANAKKKWDGSGFDASVFGDKLSQVEMLLAWQPRRGHWCLPDESGQLNEIPNYCSDWSIGGALIERYGIAVQGKYKLGELVEWRALAGGQWFHDRSGPDEVRGSTALEAAMRAFAAHVLGPVHALPSTLSGQAKHASGGKRELAL